MKWVELTCGHNCWVPWLEAHVGRQVMCPGPGVWDPGSAGAARKCRLRPQTIVRVIPRIWPKRSRRAA